MLIMINTLGSLCLDITELAYPQMDQNVNKRIISILEHRSWKKKKERVAGKLCNCSTSCDPRVYWIDQTGTHTIIIIQQSKSNILRSLRH